MQVKVAVFDLDDTLFNELDYVRSGLFHVAHILAGKLGWDEGDLRQALLTSLQVSRDQVFDRVLAQMGEDTSELIEFCVASYRAHKPDIELSSDVLELLEHLAQEVSLYIVTDGHAKVQKTKCVSLGLWDHPGIKACYVTYQLGPEFAKPSTRCFQMIAEREQCQPSDIVYIGDNPDKDFVGIKPLGFRTIRVMTGQHKHKVVNDEYDAEVSVANLQAAIEQLEF